MGLDLVYILAAFPAIVIALALHEYGHAAMAVKLGDPTPRLQGRLTLNPIAHLDPAGTFFIIITLLMGFGFGWGKPVQTNPTYYQNFRNGTILVAIAGPAMNLAQAMFSIGIAFLLFQSGASLPGFMHKFLVVYIIINIVLMVFNLLPIPPLDGGHVMEQLLPWNMRGSYRQVGQYGMLILLGMMVFGLLSTIIGFFMSIFASLVHLAFGSAFLNWLFGAL